MKLIKDFIKGFKSYPFNAYDIGQLVAENLIWWVCVLFFSLTIGTVTYILLR